MRSPSKTASEQLSYKSKSNLMLEKSKTFRKEWGGKNKSSLSLKMWNFMGSWNTSAFIICILAWLIFNPKVSQKCISISLWPSKDISLARKSREFLALKGLTHSLFLFIVSSGISSGLVGRKKIQPMAVVGILLLFARSLTPKYFLLSTASCFWLIRVNSSFFSSPDL